MKTKVIYIAGDAHSGSTLLDLILGSHTRIESVGEITMRISRILSGQIERTSLYGGLCTCGSAFLDCPYWMPIFGRIRSQNVNEQRFMLDASSAQKDNEIFIAEVLRQSGKQVYAESTKSIRRLKLLKQTDFVDLYVLHVVRDGRAVAYSNAQKGRNFYAFASRWVTVNFELLNHRYASPGRWMIVNYEHFVTRPVEGLSRIMDFVGEEFEEGQLNFAQSTHHNLAGNRMRFSATSEIVADTRYLTGIGLLQWGIATAYAYRALREFGYPLSKRRTRSLIYSQSGGRPGVFGSRPCGGVSTNRNLARSPYEDAR